MSKNYLGWKNRQTWNVCLWLMNDEGLYQALAEESKEMRNAKSEWTPALAQDFCHRWMGDHTADGISLDNKLISWKEVAECMNQEVHSI